MATYGGYGGGSGGRISVTLKVTPGQQFPVVVGAGGSPGVDWNVSSYTESQRGQAGGNSSFGDYVATGGTGGFGTTAGTGGGTLNVSGADSNALVVTTAGIAGNGYAGGGAGVGAGGAGTNVFGGNGAYTAQAGQAGIVSVWW